MTADVQEVPISAWAKRAGPFDNTRCMHDEDGRPVRFITDPLAEAYIEPPGDHCPDGMLPPQEFEVRAALIEVKVFTERLMALGLLGRLFDRAEYRKRRDVALQKQQALLTLVSSSREHKAAIRRIVSAMPSDSGAREALAMYLK